jgi:hypothetical protein
MQAGFNAQTQGRTGAKFSFEFFTADFADFTDRKNKSVLSVQSVVNPLFRRVFGSLQCNSWESHGVEAVSAPVVESACRVPEYERERFYG